VRRLTITQNITVDGSIEMLGEWFHPQAQAGADNSDLLEELHRHDSQTDAFLVGRQTFEDLRGYWPNNSDDATGIADYLNRVQKYVISSTRPTQSGRTPQSCLATPLRRFARLRRSQAETSWSREASRCATP
jgi:dihydrofolate reductase